MLRVALGRARPETEWSGKVSGLEFSSNPGGETQTSADRKYGTDGRFGTNTILTVPPSHLDNEVDIEARNVISDEESVRGKEG
jgi:hypothetical protein